MSLTISLRISRTLRLNGTHGTYRYYSQRPGSVKRAAPAGSPAGVCSTPGPQPRSCPPSLLTSEYHPEKLVKSQSESIPSTIKSWVPGDSFSLETINRDVLATALDRISLEIDQLKEALKNHELRRDMMDAGSPARQMTINAIIMVSGLLSTAIKAKEAIIVLQKALRQGGNASEVEKAVATLTPYYNAERGFLFDFEPPYFLI
ncbi:hypothetical protein BCR33DRAFT_715009 [Rhizoclosmatium globosum]|uniref:Uncharacterized protein n=1 Tax=Rhizoclosmatium globosum TaxID=329046 RepID=A0A1Y2CJQ3_9FUNG|nr:hypothetical protein BCR33DRAFT_715009 [Rhizoclosmatium globosum]|eukprot:ORY47259.1 hypothetical protein BCR33DRAFT_715009 [Rhizoclosmatium globosum]